jgi:hypothetical protein
MVGTVNLGKLLVGMTLSWGKHRETDKQVHVTQLSGLSAEPTSIFAAFWRYSVCFSRSSMSIDEEIEHLKACISIWVFVSGALLYNGENPGRNPAPWQKRR